MLIQLQLFTVVIYDYISEDNNYAKIVNITKEVPRKITLR